MLFYRLGKLLVLQGKVLDGLTLSLTLILAGNLGLGAGLATYGVRHRLHKLSRGLDSLQGSMGDTASWLIAQGWWHLIGFWLHRGLSGW